MNEFNQPPPPAAPDPLDELRGRFPGWLIDREADRFGREPRYVAIGRTPEARPNCVITDDAAELAAALTGMCAYCGRPGDDLVPCCGEHPGIGVCPDGARCADITEARREPADPAAPAAILPGGAE